MTPEEAVEQIKLRTNGGTAHAIVESWYFKASGKSETNCLINYYFHDQGCATLKAPTFEECLEQFDAQEASINSLIAKYAILLRKF